ncbi:MAG: 60S ribosomal export protein NMD3 [Candidatus Thermoplasmatota archaeon]
MFCVECGKEEKLYRSLCINCFKKKYIFTEIADYIDIQKCAYCKKFGNGGWEKSIENNLYKKIRKIAKVKEGCNVTWKVELKEENERNASAIFFAKLKVFDIEVIEEHRAKIRIRNGLCPQCSRIAGGYYEAILQIRFKTKMERWEAEKAKQYILEEIEYLCKNDKNAYISKEEAVRNGFDLYIGSKKAGKKIAKHIAEKFSGDYLETSKLYGMKNGKRVYRNTYRVRLEELFP